MSTINQKSAVYVAITHVLAEAGIKYEDGQDVSSLMTPERRALVNQILIQGFRNKEDGISCTKQYDDKHLKSYVSGLVSNWIKKDKRFNGNTAYVPKNPGSRQGLGDVALKNMKLLLATVDKEEDRVEIQAYIDAHQIEVNAKAVKKSPEVDFSKLPEALKAKYTTQV